MNHFEDNMYLLCEPENMVQFKADASKTESMVYCNVTEIDHYVRDVRLNFPWGNSRVTYLKR